MKQEQIERMLRQHPELDRALRRLMREAREKGELLAGKRPETEAEALEQMQLAVMDELSKLPPDAEACEVLEELLQALTMYATVWPAPQSKGGTA